MAGSILRKLANPAECPINLRREFLQFHLEKETPKKKQHSLETRPDYMSLLENIYNHSDGIVFGEEHFDNVSINFIAENMEYLSKIGVKTLFFEGVFFGLEHGLNGTRAIKDSAHKEYAKMIEAAEYNGVKIIGIDAAGCKRGEGITRDIFMNVYSQAIINNLGNKGKWCALVGMMHLNDSLYINPVSFEKHQVRGLSELTGSVSIILDSCGEKYIKREGEIEPIPAKKVRADFIVGLENKGATLKENIENPVANLAIKTNSVITYYDIDSYAKTNLNGDHLKGVIFALRFDEYIVSDLETLKYNVKSMIPLSDDSWLDIKIDGKEMIFSCDFNIIDKVAEVFIDEQTK